MSMANQEPIDPDLRGVPDALLRAAETARRLAQQTGTPFIVRQPEESTVESRSPENKPARPAQP